MSILLLPATDIDRIFGECTLSIFGQAEMLPWCNENCEFSLITRVDTTYDLEVFKDIPTAQHICHSQHLMSK